MTPAELERWVAEAVMGWDAYEVDIADNPDYDGELGVYIVEVYCLDPYVRVDDWHPLTDLNQCFMAVEKMREKGWWLYILSSSPGVDCVVWYCAFKEEFRGILHHRAIKGGYGEDPATAIIKAMRATLEGKADAG